MSTTSTTKARRRAGTATGPWRTIDLLTTAMIGVVFGVVYWGWSSGYTALEGPLYALGPAIGIVNGTWLLAGVVGGLVVRRPGAALVAEMLAAAVSALLGNQWGATTLVSGLVQGLGAELARAVFLYRRFTLPVALLGGILAAVGGFCYEMTTWLQGYDAAYKLGYLGTFALSGAVIAGLGGWLLTRALSRSGAIDALPAGRELAHDREA